VECRSPSISVGEPPVTCKGGVGLGLEHVVMARIYRTEFKRDDAALHRIWPEFWTPGNLPARTTVGVTALAVNALVEIDLMARRP